MAATTGDTGGSPPNDVAARRPMAAGTAASAAAGAVRLKGRGAAAPIRATADASSRGGALSYDAPPCFVESGACAAGQRGGTLFQMAAAHQEAGVRTRPK